MDFFNDPQGERDARAGQQRLINAIEGQTLRFSNFLITFSTNVIPEDDDERRDLVDWLAMVTDDMFHHWNVLNGTVLKPAGSPNADQVAFPPDHKIATCRSRISIEEGVSRKGLGQMHAHILLEVAHTYVRQEHGADGTGMDTNRLNLGVHTNVMAMRNYLNNRIDEMALDIDRRPEKIYVNSRLLTKGTDFSNKWLTLQYLDKQTDRLGNQLQVQERNAPRELSALKPGLLNADEQTVRPTTLDVNIDNDTDDENSGDPRGVGGFLDVDDAFGAESEARRSIASREARAPPVAPTFQRVTKGNIRSRAPPPTAPKAPTFRQVTSGANIGLPRLRFQPHRFRP